MWSHKKSFTKLFDVYMCDKMMKKIISDLYIKIILKQDCIRTS